MKLINIILALICFGVGFLIADSTLPPWVSALAIAAIVVVIFIIRKNSNKEN